MLLDGVDAGEHLDGPVVIERFEQLLLVVCQHMGSNRLGTTVRSPVLGGRMAEDDYWSIGQCQGLANELIVDLHRILAIVALLPMNQVNILAGKGSNAKIVGDTWLLE